LKRPSTPAPREVRITNPLGVHARPSARIVALASRFRSRVSLVVNGRSADARSIVAVMLLAANVGSIVSIEAVGPDAQEALEAMTTLISGRFDP
jgi:phosphocarrier protein HPr